MKFLNHNLFTGDITVNGTTTLSTATGVTRATGDNSTHLATTAFVKAQGYATTAALAGYVPTSRTLTINGTTYDLSANRSWTISSADGYISNVALVGSTLSFTGEGSAFNGIVDLSTLPFAPQGSYLTAEADTLATVVSRGSSTASGISVGSLTSSGNIQTSANIKAQGYLLFDYDGDFTGSNYYSMEDHSGGYFRMGYAFNSDLVISTSGNVGIGVTGPTNKLQVANGNMSITSGYSFILADTDTNWRLGRNIIVESGNNLTGSTFQLVAANAVNEGWQFVNDDGFTALEIGALTAARHVWINAGNLSVGVASPQEKIHVAGNVRIDGGSTAAILETNNAAAAEAGTTYRTFTTADHYAVFVDYVIYDAARGNMRTGTFRAVWTTGDVVYTDVSTVDLGATDNVVLSAAISGANVNLIVTGPTDYTLKYNLKVIK